MPLPLITTYKRMQSFLINLGTVGIIDEKELKRVRLINRLSSVIVLLILVIGAVFWFMTHWLLILVPAAVECPLAVIPLWLNHKRKYTAAALMTFIVQCLASLYFGLLLGKVLELQAVVFFLLLINFLIFDKPRIRLVCLVIGMAILVVLEANSFVSFFPSLPLEPPVSVVFKILSFFGLFCLIIIVGYPYITSHDASYKLKLQSDTKSTFIRHSSHEIQGAFWGISKMVSSLRKAAQREEDLDGLIDDLTDGCNAYRQMLTNLLEYAKIDAGVSEVVESEPIEIGQLLTKIIKLHAYAAMEKGVAIRLEVSPDLPWRLKGDVLRLTQICNNLLTNAIKFTRPDTEITVEADCLDGYWRLAVQDQGDGISLAEQAHIFDLYVTNRNAMNNPEGVGLGLFITKHLVEDILKGSLSVISQPHAGARFVVVLPLHPAGSAAGSRHLDQRHLR